MIETTNPFLVWAYTGRRKLLEDVYNESIKDENKLFIEFTRHTPTMITNGPSGLNGSVKGFGFVPKLENLKEITDKLMELISKGENASQKERMRSLIENIYSEKAQENLDFTKLLSLELARKHTWENVMSGNNDCTLVYYQPPMISFEVRGKVEIHENNMYSIFGNAIHDIYHSINTNIANKPVYIFNIEEVFDNSVRGFGKKIY
jgi:hypothetical protein